MAQVLIISPFYYCNYVTVFLISLLFPFLSINHTVVKLNFVKYRAKKADNTQAIYVEMSHLRDAVGVNGCPFERQYDHAYQSYKNRHPLIQSSSSRNLFCRYPCTCKDICVRMSIVALLTMARY